MPRWLLPQVEALVRHLCTNNAAAITGACLSIDGGWTAQQRQQRRWRLQQVCDSG